MTDTTIKIRTITLNDPLNTDGVIGVEWPPIFVPIGTVDGEVGLFLNPGTTDVWYYDGTQRWYEGLLNHQYTVVTYMTIAEGDCC